MDTAMLEWLGNQEKEEGFHYLYVIRWYIMKCQNLLWCVTILIKINYLDYKLIVGVVYKPPNSNMVDFNDSMHDILETLLTTLVILWAISI